MSYRAEIVEMLRKMPPGWQRQYAVGQATLARNGGPVLPNAPTPEQAMLILGNSAGRNFDPETPRGDQPVPKAVRDAAMKGLRLSYRNNYGGWEFFGIARAIQIALVPQISLRGRERMVRYLNDHERDKAGANFGDDRKPSRGYMAWLNWGGDSAMAWNERDGIERATYGASARRTNGATSATAKLGVKLGAKVGIKGGGKLIPYVGEALMAYDVAREGRNLYRRRKAGERVGWTEGGVRLASSAIIGPEGVEWAKKKLDARKARVNGLIKVPPEWTAASVLSALEAYAEYLKKVESGTRTLETASGFRDVVRQDFYGNPSEFPTAYGVPWQTLRIVVRSIPDLGFFTLVGTSGRPVLNLSPTVFADEDLLWDTVVHELRHYVQYLLGLRGTEISSGSKLLDSSLARAAYKQWVSSPRGLPKRSARASKGVSAFGSEEADDDLDHALRDIEYQTRLADEIENVKRRAWEYLRQHKENALPRMMDAVSSSPTFQHWKKHAPEKFKLALSAAYVEFDKALAEEKETAKIFAAHTTLKTKKAAGKVRKAKKLDARKAKKNPGSTSAVRTDPELWEAVKAEVTRGDRGGLPGQWSARKAQMSVALYKDRGGGYVGPKSPRNSLAKWTREQWRTKSGRPSLETGERYLPSAAIAALTPAEYAATTRAKRAGMRKGEQFVPQPESIAEKVKRYRRNPWEIE
jgi:hypothetical protein